MRVRVELFPRGPYSDVVLLVDVLRASTSIALLLSRGAREVWVTASLRVARELPADLRLAEREGLPPEGFDRGTSPAELLELDLGGRRVVYTSENLPRALALAQGARAVLLGAFRNARAAVRAAARLAETEVAVVAVGHRGREALEDALGAGFLAKALARAQGADPDDGARIAAALLKAFPDPQEALWQSASGRLLRDLGYLEDLAQASVIGVDPAVPRLAGVDSHRGRAVYRFVPDAPD